MALAIASLTTLKANITKGLNLKPGQPLKKLSPDSRWNKLLGKNISPEKVLEKETVWAVYTSDPTVGPVFRHVRSKLTFIEKLQQQFDQGPRMPKKMNEQQWGDLIARDESYAMAKYMEDEPRVVQAVMRKFGIPTPKEALEHLMADFEPVLDNLEREAEKVDLAVEAEEKKEQELMAELNRFVDNIENVSINALYEAFPEEIDVVLDDMDHYRWDSMPHVEEGHH